MLQIFCILKIQPYEQAARFLPAEVQPYYSLVALLFGLFLVVVSRFISRFEFRFTHMLTEESWLWIFCKFNRKKPTMSKKQIKVLTERREFIQNHIKNKKVVFF